MPVRIYEIAKDLNLESRLVLLKAKELGITAAKVPSSSLDKITAEYLREQLLPLSGGAVDATGEAAPAPVPPPERSEPAPVNFVRPPPPPVVEPEPEEETVAAPEPVTRETATSVGTDRREPIVPPSEHPSPKPSAADAPATIPVTAAESLSHPETPAALPRETPSAPVPSPVPETTTPPAPPRAEPVLSVRPAPAPPATPPQRPWTPPTVPAAVPSPARPAETRSAAPSAPSSPSPTPAAPARPGLGDKVGFINLGNLGRSAGRSDDRRPDNRGAARPATPSGPPRPGGNQGPGQSSNTGGQGGQRPPMNRPGDHRRDDRRPGHGPQHQAQRPSAPTPARPAPPKLDIAANAPTIIMRPPIVVRELAEKMGRRPFQVIADLMQMGVFATVTQTIDTEVAAKVSAKHGFRFETEKRDKAAHVVNVPKEQKVELDQEDTEASLKARPPVVTIMGHVDHGKTTLLDRIRKSNVASGEAGGITQHIGAYTIAYPHPVTNIATQMTFLDTPGHAAFSAMRARGANVTDIVILVVAANDGVMPQTLEALAHAKQARVPIIVAVNKCDHPAANTLKVRQQLQDKGLLPDDWGGDTLYVDCSGLTGVGVEKLIEAILLQAELLELRANPDRKAKGNVIESGVEPGGPVATVLVRKGTLNVGDVVICGEFYGKVRAMMNEEGQRLKVATPSMAVRVLGLNGVPDAGSEFSAIENEKSARDLAENRFEERKRAELEGVRPRRQTLEDLYSQMKDLTAKVLKVIVKADTQGSVEAICEALGKIETNKVQLDIIHSAVGAITEHDVLLASSGNAVVLGFHTRVDSTAAEAAKHEGVQIKLYAIIYELIDQVKEAMAGLLDPLLKEVVVGQAEVRKVFELSKGGKVAGCAVTNGRLVRGKLRVRRRGNLIYEGVSQTLKRFQDEVNEVKSGLECGIRLDGFDDFIEGDIIECYTTEKVTQKL
jgi:translation initiation factor IF-2